ncbi:DUF4339 domain-containing protein [Paraflavitalea speifideaquila]|uniref:DUF4339 domain-containing protein n=1 Tax=Paraflavitalea speifideaquila TaxID=3076558 RepID=UPI0028E41418|nr:DUF4339 domain-containing protein [Paraflavitalea speifideiaquila]
MKKYYLYNGAQYGPFSYAELKHQHLLRDTPIWYEGLNEWVTAGSVVELQAILPAPCPPPFVVANANNSNSSKTLPPPATSKIKTRFLNKVFLIGCLIACLLVVLTLITISMG